MTLYIMLEDKLGLLTIPLLVLAIIAAMLMLELSVRILRAISSKSGFRDGYRLFEIHQAQPRDVREEVVEIWLAKKQAALIRGTGLLQLIGLLAPITGLLGTVFGLISAFDAISLSTESVNPSLVAEGLGLAMNTTAAGLIIALPSLLVANLVRLGAERYIASLGFELSEASLRDSIQEESIESEEGSARGESGKQTIETETQTAPQSTIESRIAS
jgi:biopolymer transport protein ExbB